MVQQLECTKCKSNNLEIRVVVSDSRTVFLQAGALRIIKSETFDQPIDTKGIVSSTCLACGQIDKAREDGLSFLAFLYSNGSLSMTTKVVKSVGL